MKGLLIFTWIAAALGAGGQGYSYAAKCGASTGVSITAGVMIGVTWPFWLVANQFKPVVKKQCANGAEW
jgi:hypothetical protein